MKYAVLPLSLLSAVLLSACDPAIVSALSGGKTVDEVLKSYNPTYATGQGAPSTYDAGQQAGLEGFGAGTPTDQAAADLVGSYKTGKIKGDANSLTVTVDGHDYTMTGATGAYSSASVTDSNGHRYWVRVYGNTQTVHTTHGDVLVAQGTAAEQLGLGDVSLTLFVKNLAQTYDSTGDVWSATYDGYSIIAAGRETDPSRLPTTVATYQGQWIIISGLGINSANSANATAGVGYFAADVNFATKAVHLTGNDSAGGFTPGSQTLFSGDGTLLAGTNKFTGTVAGDGFTGTVAGGFYGTDAQQIGGVGVGTSGGKNAVMGFEGTTNLGTFGP